MNYLAHAYLSFGDHEILVGNLISDFVKGKNKFSYSAGIQNGISLHRSIDSFTDSHEATQQAKAVFRPNYRLYSGAFVDVVYDHFLANDPGEFQPGQLENFSQGVYSVLQSHVASLPEKFAAMFPHMRSHDWLSNYRTRWGTRASFGGLVKRANYLTESEIAASLFETNYELLQHCYQAFFPEVKVFAYTLFEQMVKL